MECCTLNSNALPFYDISRITNNPLLIIKLGHKVCFLFNIIFAFLITFFKFIAVFTLSVTECCSLLFKN
jgi:hypothetical protein